MASKETPRAQDLAGPDVSLSVSKGRTEVMGPQQMRLAL